MKKNKIFLAFLIAFINPETFSKSNLDYESVWTCNTKKANWYCDEPKKQTQTQTPLILQKPKQQQKVADPQIFTPLHTIKTAEALRAEEKKRLDIATMNPTEENIKKYLEVNTLLYEKASVFTDQWRRVVYQNPEFDYSLKNPSNNSAINVQKEVKKEQMDNYMKNLGREHGLIFFFRSDCPYCHQMAPTLKMLSKIYGVEVLGVSIDGKGLPDFPDFKDGRAVAQKWGVEAVPATFIASKRTNEHAPIGFGVMSFNEIIERIWVLTNTKPGQEF